MPQFTDIVEAAGRAIDAIGVAVTVLGTLVALALYAGALRRPVSGLDAYRLCRQRVGRSILLGLELLVAGDIIRTVAISPSFATVGVLALIVLIRTFLSTTLEVEIAGHWPWQRRSEL